jgi:hypothetical protein
MHVKGIFLCLLRHLHCHREVGVILYTGMTVSDMTQLKDVIEDFYSSTSLSQGSINFVKEGFSVRDIREK